MRLHIAEAEQRAENRVLERFREVSLGNALAGNRFRLVQVEHFPAPDLNGGVHRGETPTARGLATALHFFVIASRYQELHRTHAPKRRQKCRKRPVFCLPPVKFPPVRSPIGLRPAYEQGDRVNSPCPPCPPCNVTPVRCLAGGRRCFTACFFGKLCCL